jgi:phenylpropionate dioxygenase-like ring-hydroxylating dioxygenase large terminal subunit
MLSAADNELLTRVGPGTPMGALMREYWLPAMLSSELPRPDGEPIRVMLLGEQLIGFRDSAGRVGLIQNHCPHRGASLFFGRNEEGGIRCVYHGWKFDCGGKCVDMPNEPAESNFKEKIKARAYPCVERAGIVWAYLGPRSTPPPLPGLEALEVPDGEYDVGACLRSCSWLQALEGDLDTSHVSFLHGGSRRLEDIPVGSDQYYMTLHRAPRYAVLDTDYGVMYGAYRPADEGENYWRIAQFLFPCFTHIPGWPTLTRAWVPMDDTHTMFFVMDRAYPGRPTGEGIFWSSDPEARVLSYNTSHWFGRFRSAYQAEDDYELDRQRQREDHSMWGFTGIIGVQTQDQAVTESMGGVLDRTIEHVGAADVMVLQLRRRLLDVVRMHAAGDEPPPGVDDPDVYQTRSAAIRLPVGVDWLRATESARAVESTRTTREAKGI